MCYTVPLAASIIVSATRRSRKSPRVWWLNLLLLGGAIFGIVDHIWNGELILVSDNLLHDLGLGALITVAIFACWGIIVAISKPSLDISRDVVVARPKDK